MTIARACCAVVCALAAAACMVERRPPDGALVRTSEPPRIEVRRKTDPRTGALLREWSVAIARDRPPVKHGKETIWSASGTKQWEREYAGGKPAGAWRSWYENGKPRTECFYGDAQVDTQMTFWHANGNVSMQGPARNGVRRGTWRIWYQNGQLAEEGTFVDSMRHGTWRAWSTDGTEAFERTYVRNVRTSQVRSPSASAPSVAPAPHDTPATTSSEVGDAPPPSNPEPDQ